MKHAQILHWSFFPLVYISIPDIVYIQFYLWKQQFSIQKPVQTTETLMQIHNVTQTIWHLLTELIAYSSAFTKA